HTLPDGCPRLIDSIRRFRHVHVDTDAYHDMADIGRIAGELQENPGYLSPLDQHVIGPLQLCALHTACLQCLNDSEPHRQTQCLDLAHPTIDTQHDAAVEIICERTDPDAPAPTTASRLTLSQQHKRRSRPRPETAKDLGIRGIYARLDCHRPAQIRYSLRYPLGIEQDHGRRQPIAATRDLEYLDPQLCLQALQLLPDGAATYPELPSEGFTGMESTILQKFQQFQHARPRYEQGWHDNDGASACI